MTTKLLIIGIDALDILQLEKYRSDVTAFARLQKVCPAINLCSVTPPDSDTAWASIQTGLNPARHGIVKYDDPIEKSNRLASADVDNSFLRERTVWDFVGRAGKKVCVLFPHLGYPVWPVNGVMVGRSGFNNFPSVYPPDFQTSLDLQKLNVVKGFPGNKKRAYILANENLLLNQKKFAIEMLQKDTWDLFFVYTSILDMIQHYFWSFCDPRDPSYPGPNRYENVIRDFYVLHDRFVDELVLLAGPEAVTIVLSDHGHGLRPQKVFNVNEFLRRNHWLALKDDQIFRKAAGLVESSKQVILRTISQHNLGGLASNALHLLPWVRKLYSKPITIDWERTQAYSMNLSGVKAYNYGGIKICRDYLGQQEYETLRDEIIRSFSEQILEGRDAPVLRWIKRREEIYSGIHLDKYPDLLFELEEGLGAGMTFDGKLYGTAPLHSLVPGSHRPDTAVFFLHNCKIPIMKNRMNLEDLTPTVLDILSIPNDNDLDGKSIFS